MSGASSCRSKAESILTFEEWRKLKPWLHRFAQVRFEMSNVSPLKQSQYQDAKEVSYRIAIDRELCQRCNCNIPSCARALMGEGVRVFTKQICSQGKNLEQCPETQPLLMC